jgi:hypothetical protein
MQGDRIRNFRAAIISAVLSAVALDGIVSEMVEEVLTADPPVRSIVELSKRMHRERAELSGAWRKAMRDRPHLLLHEFIDVASVCGGRQNATALTAATSCKLMHVRELRLRRSAGGHWHLVFRFVQWAAPDG